jgi:Gas vesicle synthesis protein GvpL/GvpF
MAEGPLGTYVYCVTAGGTSSPPEGLPGVDPRFAVRAIRHAGIVALASPVPLSEFGAEPLKRHLNDLSWLERVARTHQRVLDAALQELTIVPLRLCTVFEDDARVEAMLERERDVLTAALARLEGRQEWAVKLIAQPQAERSAAASGDDVPPSGRAYVDRLRRDRAARSDAQRVARAAAQEIHQALAAHAVAARVLRKPSRELSDDGGELVLNGAYLVNADHVPEFRAAVTELGSRHSARGMRVETTGPWPPYSFVAERTDERRQSGAGVR